MLQGGYRYYNHVSTFYKFILPHPNVFNEEVKDSKTGTTLTLQLVTSKIIRIRYCNTMLLLFDSDSQNAKYEC